MIVLIETWYWNRKKNNSKVTAKLLKWKLWNVLTLSHDFDCHGKIRPGGQIGIRQFQQLPAICDGAGLFKKCSLNISRM